MSSDAKCLLMEKPYGFKFQQLYKMKIQVIHAQRYELQKKKTMITSFSHDEQDCKPENLSLAFAISEEPQRSLSPYIKAFDSSIISWHMRYCMRTKLIF